MIIKVKELPEKAALELSEDDTLIIEDNHKTCQIKLSELSTYIRNGLIDKDSFIALLDNELSPILERIQRLESESRNRWVQLTEELGILII